MAPGKLSPWPCRGGHREFSAIGAVSTAAGRSAGSLWPVPVGKQGFATTRTVAGETARGHGLDGQDGVQSGDRQGTAGQPPRPVQDQLAVDGPQLIVNLVKHCQPDGTQNSSPDKSTTIFG